MVLTTNPAITIAADVLRTAAGWNTTASGVKTVRARAQSSSCMTLSRHGSWSARLRSRSVGSRPSGTQRSARTVRTVPYVAPKRTATRT